MFLSMTDPGQKRNSPRVIILVIMYPATSSKLIYFGSSLIVVCVNLTGHGAFCIWINLSACACRNRVL